MVRLTLGTNKIQMTTLYYLHTITILNSVSTASILHSSIELYIFNRAKGKLFGKQSARLRLTLHQWPTLLII